jgi:hypothetical protein
VAKAVLKIDENGGITGFPSAIFFHTKATVRKIVNTRATVETRQNNYTISQNGGKLSES